MEFNGLFYALIDGIFFKIVFFFSLLWRFESKEIEEGIGPKKLLSARSSVVSCVS